MRSEVLCCYLALAMLLGGSLLIAHADATVNILPLGDSITRGGTTPDSPYPSYRYLLWNYLKTGGYDVNFVGSTTYPTFSSFSYDQNHEGHGGYTTGTILSGDSSDDPQAKLSNWLKLYTPDIVLLHIGTNDVIQQVPLSQRLSNVAQIIDTLRADNPKVKILLAQIIPTSDVFRNTNSGLIAYNNAVPGLAAQKSTTQSPVIVVDQYSGYDGFKDNQYDGIHPQTSGEKKMADRWYAALVPVLSGGSGTPVQTPVQTPAPWDSPQQIPGSIQGADYAPGGEGVAYHDTTTGNQGGAYRNDDVDIEYSSVEQEFVVGYIRSGEWLTYDVNVASAGIYTVAFRVSSTSTGSTVDLEVDGSEVTMIQVPNTGSYDSYTIVQRPVYLPGGHHTLKLDFQGSSNLNYLKFTTGMPTPTVTGTPVPTGTTVAPTGTQTVKPTVTTTQVERAYVSHTFPCKVEAEDYDLGGEGIAFHDTTLGNLGGEYRSDDVDIEATPGGGINVGYIRNGEWLAYTVNVPTTRTYVATFRANSWFPGRSILVQVDGTPVTAVGIPDTNASNVYDTTQVALPMAQGLHRITLTFNGDGQNLDWFDVTNDVPATTVPTTVATTTVPTTTVPTTVATTTTTKVPTTVMTTVQPTQTSNSYVTHRPPARIEAEDYDLGGEGVAYHDTTLTNLGGQYRTDDVDIETIPGGGYNVGFVRDGEWLTYTIDVPSTSAYTAAFRVASWSAGRSISLSVDGAPATTVPVAMTGSYTIYTLSAVAFTMTQGTHKIRLSFNGDGQNLDYFDLIPGNFAPTTVPTTIVPTTVSTTVTTTATTVPTTIVTTARTTVPTTTMVTTVPTTIVPTTVATTVTTTGTVAPSGTIWQIPTHIEAENYDLGGEGVAYHDTTPGNLGGQYRTDDVDIETIPAGGYDIGYVRDGEWLQYHIRVQNPGTYTVTFRAGSWYQGRAITISVDGVGAAVAAIPYTGSSSAYTTTVVGLPLTVGDHVLRLTFEGDGQNLDWFALDPGMIQTTTATTIATTVPTTVKPTTVPPTTTTTIATTVPTTVKPTTVSTTATQTIPTIPISTAATTLPLPDTKAYKSLLLPGRLQAEDYDNGSEGIAYHDTTVGNQGGAYRSDDVDIENLLDNSGYDVCWIRDGEWLQFTVNIQQTKTYGATFRVASPQAGGQCELKIDGRSEVTANVPNTGSFDTYQLIGTQLPLTAGQHTITLAFHGSRMNIDYIDFT